MKHRVRKHSVGLPPPMWLARCGRCPWARLHKTWYMAMETLEYHAKHGCPHLVLY